MMRQLLFFVFLCLLNGGNIFAQDSGFGLGIILGEPTGISCKLWTKQNIAINGAAAWSIEEKKSFHLHGDYLIHRFGYFNIKEGKLPVYHGIGGRIKLTKDKYAFGVRFPFGLSYIYEKESIDIFYEIVPILNLFPSTTFNLNGGIGVRYYF